MTNKKKNILFFYSILFLIFFFLNSNIYADCPGCADICSNPSCCDNWRCSCGGCETPCTPSSCVGCTPYCPDGQSTITTGELCKQNLTTCIGSNGCSSCTLTGSEYCYLPETNIFTPTQPNKVSILVDGVEYELSTDKNNPTVIDLGDISDLDELKENENITEKLNSYTTLSGYAGINPVSEEIYSKIEKGETGMGDSDGVFAGSIVNDNEIYKMWYTGYDGSKYRIYYATSNNGGRSWVKYNNEKPPVSDKESSDGRIGLGTSGKGDDFSVRNPSVIKDGNTFKMWYAGSDGSNYRIYYATSNDGGLTWRKVNNNTPDLESSYSFTTHRIIKTGYYDYTIVSDIVFDPNFFYDNNGRMGLGYSSTNDGDDFQILGSSVIKDGDMYKMWYMGSDGNNYRIYYAVSQNGLGWKKHTNSIEDNSDIIGTYGRIPLGTTGKGDSKDLGGGVTVIKDNGIYKMWYGGSDGTNYRIYYATSIDGITWKKENNAIPKASNVKTTNGRIALGINSYAGNLQNCSFEYISGELTLHCESKKTLISDDVNGTSYPVIIFDNDTYKLWYTGKDEYEKILYSEAKKDYLIQLSTQTIMKHPTAREVGYEYRVDNHIKSTELENNLSCTNTSEEDFCTRDIFPNQDFVPESSLISEVLQSGATGKVSVMSYYLDKCDDDKKYSLPLEGFYKINNKSKIVDPCASNPSIKSDDPNCPEEPICEMEYNEDCTIDNIITEKVKCNGGNYENWYTGKDQNNPLKVRIAIQDDDGPSDIKGVISWFSINNEIPKKLSISDEYTSTETENLGILISKSNNSWENPNIYASSNESFGKLSEIDNELVIKNTEGEEIASLIKNTENNFVKVYEGSIVTFEFEIIFSPTNSEENIGGIYKFNAQGVEKSTIVNSNISTRNLTKLFDWGIDLEDPRVEEFEEEILTPTTLTLSWDIDGTKSNVIDLIINAYRIEPTENGIVGSISMTDPDKGEIQLSEFDNPTSEDIGRYDDTNTWQFNDLVVSNPYSDEGIVDIGVNELGAIAMYATAFDQACNYSSNSFNVNLNHWFATQGGVVYSKGYAGIGAKQTLEGINISLKLPIDKGTELVTSKHQVMDNLLNPALGAVRAVNIYDSNERKNFWYDYFTRKLEEQRDSLKEIVAIADCNEGESCLLESETSITIPEDSVCNGKILVKSDENISITPNITSAGATSGCIFLAKENIYIKGGDYLSSGSEVEYDFMEGFLIAEGKVEIEYVDQTRIIRDGLEVKGGFIGLGKEQEGSSGVDIRRDLRLYNYSHPTVVVTSDVKYLGMSKTFFGTEAPMYKQEIGFKGL